MNRKSLMIILIIMISIIFQLKSEVKAEAFMAGAELWIANYKSEGVNSDKPFLMYGPVFAFVVDKKWTFSTKFIIGQFENNISKTEGTIKADGQYNYLKLESDNAISYPFFNYFKVFMGFKYLGESNKVSVDAINTFDLSEQKSKSELYINNYGPGFGLSFSYYYKGFFFQGSVSGLYLWKMGRGETEDVLTSTIVTQNEISGYQTGVNSKLSIAYYIPYISTTISIGYRYQFLIGPDTNVTTNISSGLDASETIDKTIHFHGVTITAVYLLRFD